MPSPHSDWPDSDRTVIGDGINFPHADTRVLHEPGACPFCDRFPDYQVLRLEWGIAFTGKLPTGNQVPCPYDDKRRAAEHRWIIDGHRSLLKTLDELGDDGSSL